MHTASNQRAQGGGKLCKFDKSQRFPPDGDGQIAIGKAGGQLFFGDLSAEGGVQGVDQRLAPLGESGPDDTEEERLVRDVHRRLIQYFQTHHCGGDLGGGQEALPGHLKEILAPGVILAQQGEGAVICRARLSTDAPGHLPHRIPAAG